MSQSLLLQLLVAPVLAALLAWLLRIAFLSADARDWPETEGTVLASMLTEKHDEDPERFVIKVRYSYTVNGEPFEGSRTSFGRSFDTARFAFRSRAQAEARLEGLTPHKKVSVRYDPRRPSRCTLRAGTSMEIYLSILLVTVMLGGLLGNIISGFR